MAKNIGYNNVKNFNKIYFESENPTLVSVYNDLNKFNSPQPQKSHIKERKIIV